MFKFSFNVTEEDAQNQSTETECKERNWIPAQEIDVTKKNEEILATIDSDSISNFAVCDINIKHVSVSYILPELLRKTDDENDTNSIAEPEILHSDLIPAKYEGGLKVWECTKDLSEYLFKLKEDFKDKTILDLGCGSGILGILCLQQNATVHFQDYNSEVINYVTIPNVLLNLNERKQIKYYFGDWESFAHLLTTKNQTYDLILTSETIYNTENYDKLHLLFCNCLSMNGKIILAAKTFYFGVGGGTRQFESFLDKKGIFTHKVVWKWEDGVNREILEITRK